VVIARRSFALADRRDHLVGHTALCNRARSRVTRATLSERLLERHEVEHSDAVSRRHRDPQAAQHLARPLLTPSRVAPTQLPISSCDTGRHENGSKPQ
jgi:hypothetical protein